MDNLLIYKLASIIGGVLIVFFGYRLFAMGVFAGSAEEINATFKDIRSGLINHREPRARGRGGLARRVRR